MYRAKKVTHTSLVGRFIALALTAMAVLSIPPFSIPCLSISVSRADDETKPTKSGYALLVGCTTYTYLPESIHLKGPGNDVLLMRDLLVTKFGMPAEQVVVLAESSGSEDKRPTRANIVREIKHLIDVVRQGDQVVLLFSGHGSQQPDQDPPSPDDPEPDGLDEIFLPADAKAWDGGTGTVENSIVDDELHEWLTALQTKGAAIWVTMDACHSGTMTRGVGEQTREVHPEAIVPQDVIDKAVARAQKTGERSRGGDPPPASTLNVSDAKPGLVAISASQATEVTIEKNLPPNSADSKPYGLLTYTMNQILTQATQPLTYAELVQRVQTQYVNWGRTSPTPLIEGADRDREVLGQRKWPARSRFVLVNRKKEWLINGGSLQGLTTGSVLEVFPPAGTKEQTPQGYVRVVSLKTVEASVEPCEWNGQPPVQSLPVGGRCEVVSIDYGSNRLRIAVDPRDFDDKPVAAAQKQQLVKILQKISSDNNSLVQPVEDAAQADWVLRCREGEVFLLPASGWPKGDNSTSIAPFGPAPSGEEASTWIAESLQKIARAESLKRLASTAADELARGKGDLRIQTELRLKAAADPEGQRLEWKRAGMEVHDEDHVICLIRNPGRVPIDVSLLYVDSGYGIEPLFPKDGEYNRIQPGESVPVRFQVNADTSGLEHLVIIAVKGKGPPQEFSALAQPTIEQARSRGGPDAMESPLGKLFQNALFAQGTSRGASRAELNDHDMQLVSLRVLARKRQ